jgi:hypothetical protein
MRTEGAGNGIRTVGYPDAGNHLFPETIKKAEELGKSLAK